MIICLFRCFSSSWVNFSILYLATESSDFQLVAIGLHTMFFYDFVVLFWSCGWGFFIVSDLCIYALSLNLIPVLFPLFSGFVFICSAILLFLILLVLLYWFTVIVSFVLVHSFCNFLRRGLNSFIFCISSLIVEALNFLQAWPCSVP